MTGNDRQLWQGVLTHLKHHHAAACRQWFEEIEPLGVHAGTFILRAQSDVHRDYLRSSAADAFNDSARVVSRHLLTVQFLGPADPDPRGSSQAELKPAALNGSVDSLRSDKPDKAVSTHQWELVSPKPLSTDSLVFNPDYSFDNFIVGPANRLAHAAALAVAQNPGKAYNPYFVYGGVGLGKTHLLHSISLRIRELNPGARIYYTSCEGFISQYVAAIKASDMDAFRHRFRDVDLLVIDDIHFLANMDGSQEEFHHTFNTLHQLNKQIVLSSDAPPEDIPRLQARLVSRFKWGLVTSVSPPTFETRIDIIKEKARVRGVKLTDDVVAYVAAKIDKNIRELEGAVTKLHVVASVERRPIDLPTAQLALGDTPGTTERHIPIETILGVLVEHFNVKMAELQGKRRHRSIALPRQVGMLLARRLTRFSLEEIGGHFGGRDHTTVMHGIKTVEDRCQCEPDFKRQIEALEARVKATPAL